MSPLPQRIHMTGIGGAGMSALAEVLLARGHTVSGTDAEDSPLLRRLGTLGAKVQAGHSAACVNGAELLVWSSAIRSDHAERLRARELGIADMRRGTLLATLFNAARGVAVAGAHGKTSTSALLTHVLTECGLDPTAVVGGTLPWTGSGARVAASAGILPTLGPPASSRPVCPRSDGILPACASRLDANSLFVAESDESDGSFLELEPALAVVTNVDREHLEHYGSFDGLRVAFATFVRAAREGAVLCADDAGAMELVPHARRVATYGFAAAAKWRAVDLRTDGLGTGFTLLRAGEACGQGRVPLPGRHYVQNATGVVAAAVLLGADVQRALAALSTFPGVERRFTVLGERDGITVVDDYGHHPVEIRATLLAARQCTRGRIHTVFQPHRFTRTRDLLDEFAAAFADTDTLLLLPIYAAGDTPLPGITSEALAARIAQHRSVEYCATLDEATQRLRARAAPSDLVLCLGAGDVNRIGPAVLRA